MRPDDVVPTPDTSTPQPEASFTVANVAQQAAAADVVRSQINSLYNAPGTIPTAASLDPLTDVNPYDRTHSAHPQPTEADWQQYHSAWQTYYQKYYEGYYTHHLTKAQKNLDNTTGSTQGYFHTQPLEPEPDTVSKEEALYDLRQKLLARVQSSARTVRKSRHFVPIAAALSVVLVFLFLQYNRVLIANVEAYVSPGNIDPQNIVIDPSTDVTVTPNPKLIIPKINVDVPVIYDVGNDFDSQMAAMTKGVAHFAIPGANSRPGQIGNTVISGHSSNDLLEIGDYKFIFAQLEKLVVGDTIYINYESKRYTYIITRTEVVKPTEVSKLVYAPTKPVLTLITCTPLGTALNRLLVTAEQLSPDPTVSTPAPAAESVETATIPGNAPTLFERIFGRQN